MFLETMCDRLIKIRHIDQFYLVENDVKVSTCMARIRKNHYNIFSVCGNWIYNDEKIKLDREDNLVYLKYLVREIYSNSNIIIDKVDLQIKTDRKFYEEHIIKTISNR